MTITVLDRLLSEWKFARRASPDPELEALQLTLLVEDALGITLTDDQISLAFLLDQEALHRLMADHSAVH